MTALAEVRQAKRTLRTYVAEIKPAPENQCPRGGSRPAAPQALASAVRDLLAHERPHAGKLGARPGEAERSGRLTDQSGQTISGHCRTARRDLNTHLACKAVSPIREENMENSAAYSPT